MHSAVDPSPPLLGALCLYTPPALGVAFAVSPSADGGTKLVAWLSSDAQRAYGALRRPSGFWMEFAFGPERYWIRFEYRTSAFNRSAWEGVEARRALDSAPPPPDAVWLPTRPRNLPT